VLLVVAGTMVTVPLAVRLSEMSVNGPVFSAKVPKVSVTARTTPKATPSADSMVLAQKLGAPLFSLPWRFRHPKE
jgi:hypothetical protein